MDNQISEDDILVWPDGTWCYRDQLPGMSHMSDDYHQIGAYSLAWREFLDNEFRD